MMSPFVPSGVEQWRELAGQRISSGDASSLISVAVDATCCEIACNRAALVLAGGDMIDLEGDAGAGLRQLTVFAPPPGPLPYQSLERGVHAGGSQACLFRARRALACTRSRNALTRR